MKYATEEEKKAYTENLMDVMMMPNVGTTIFDQLWNHQIPEDIDEWYRNLCHMKTELELAESQVEFLKKEVDAQSYIGLAMFYARVESEDSYETSDNQAI